MIKHNRKLFDPEKDQIVLIDMKVHPNYMPISLYFKVTNTRLMPNSEKRIELTPLAGNGIIWIDPKEVTIYEEVWE